MSERTLLASTALRALEMGLPVVLDGLAYFLDDSSNLCYEVPVTRSHGDTTTEGTVGFKSDMTVGVFISKCKEMAEDDYAVICANIALNRVGKSSNA